MSWKIVLLIGLLLSATAVTFLACESPLQKAFQKSQCANDESYALTYNVIKVEPTEEIDTPGGPTITQQNVKEAVKV